MEEPVFDADPLQLLATWHREAHEKGICDPDAMTLATASPSGRPTARIVLFKGLDAGDILFVSNYASRKGREIDHNPQVALVFYWPALLRQIRVEGRAHRAAPEASDAYFRKRPRESQLGAWASSQSEPIASRAELERRFAETEARFSGRDVERPPGWGMYRVTPRSVEVWIGGAHRLHDRFLFERVPDGSWSSQRLCP